MRGKLHPDIYKKVNHSTVFSKAFSVFATNSLTGKFLLKMPVDILVLSSFKMKLGASSRSILSRDISYMKLFNIIHLLYLFLIIWRI